MNILPYFIIGNICTCCALDTRKTLFFLEPKNGENEVCKQIETERNRQYAHE